MARKRSKFNVYRAPLQILIVLLLAYMVVRSFTDSGYLADFEAYCPFGGLQALGSFLVSETLACSMTSLQIAMGVTLVVGVLLLGKLFCGFLCPVGTVSEWLGGLGRRLGVRYTIKGAADRLLRLPKYALLFATFYFTLQSSELFCKQYDPFYAVFSGFDADVVLKYAIPALAITILGAVFIRLFWCKYLCPLGAVTNLFANALMTIPVLALYIILRKVGVELHWAWPLGVICGLGALLEMFRVRGLLLPPLAITRNADTCTSCRLCDKACPMGLDVVTVDKVRHIDCHLCGECLGACPEKNTLTINRKPLRWLPPAAVIVLTALGIFFGSRFEVPTINLRWADEQALAGAEVFTMSGIKSIKCFGSATGFANQMKRVDGVYGVEAYVKAHRVKVFYDPALLDDQKIKAAIFNPARSYLKSPPPDGEVAILELKIDRFFDGYDNYYLGLLLDQADGVYGYTTEFGEPVSAKFFFDPAAQSPESLKRIVESPVLAWEANGAEQSEKLDFEVTWMGETVERIDAMAFMRMLFRPYRLDLNEPPADAADRLRVYRIPMEQAMRSSLMRDMRFLCAHLAADEGLLRFETVLADRPYARISFLADVTTPDAIYGALTAPVMTFDWSDGSAAEIPNPFEFGEKGEVLPADGN